LKGDRASAEVSGRRLDQWLWFARLVKSRSLAARLCATGAVTVNGMTVRKSNHMLRIGDILIVPQGALCRTVKVLSFGARRGPASEASKLYEESASAVERSDLVASWTPLLADDQPPKISP
jgi:ribosome-associated heat shock protein Hsp15